ncbi:MAG: 3-dehydroquinate synthase [Desulfobacterales bacterium]
MKLIKPESRQTEKHLGGFPFEDYRQSFTVSFDYPVSFTRDLFHPTNNLLISVMDRPEEHRRHRIKVFVDDGVVRATPGIVERIEAYFQCRQDSVEPVGTIEIVPGGERQKDGWDLARRIMDNIAASHLCRQSYVIAIGGGSVLDIVGFAASLVHRGTRLIRIPTTVLAQNDAGVGVKNGIDDCGMKNFAGTFAPPFAVLSDYEFLRTLSDKYWLGGIAEAYKVAIIKDREFFDDLCRVSIKLRNRDEAAMEAVVKRCAISHLEHIRNSGDPFEFGASRPLDFGHWCAHKLELLSDYDIGHGQAVSIGIALDTHYACQVGLISLHEQDAIIDALIKTGLPIWSDFLEMKAADGRLEILRGLDDFQEHLGGELHIALPNGIGQSVEVHKMDADIIAKTIAYLKQRASLTRIAAYSRGS